MACNTFLRSVSSEPENNVFIPYMQALLLTDLEVIQASSNNYVLYMEGVTTEIINEKVRLDRNAMPLSVAYSMQLH